MKWLLETFLSAFQSSQFFATCKQSVNGKLSWFEWENCSKTCKSDQKCGVRIRIAESCVPEYAVCKQIQVQREECNCQACPPPEPALTELPIGSIIPWVPKPSSSATGSVHYKSYAGWIKCDGIETCDQGPFKGSICTDLADRTLIGSTYTFKTLNTYGASFPDHKHPHTHQTNVRV